MQPAHIPLECLGHQDVAFIQNQQAHITGDQISPLDKGTHPPRGSHHHMTHPVHITGWRGINGLANLRVVRLWYDVSYWLLGCQTSREPPTYNIMGISIEAFALFYSFSPMDMASKFESGRGDRGLVDDERKGK